MELRKVESLSLEGYRITVVHSFYRGTSVSGENLAVDLQTAALASAGAQVDLVERSTDALAEQRTYAVQSWLRVATGIDIGGQDLPPCEGPRHILVVHNLFPNFGVRKILEWPGPVLVMIHNYRYLCSNGLLLRNGRECHDCLKGDSWPAIQHACYRDSRMATLPLAIATWGGANRNPLLNRANGIVYQSDRAQRIYEMAGVDPGHTSMIPGFTPNPQVMDENPLPAKGWIFVGRMSPEKGLIPLLQEWPDDVQLDVVGDGPEFEFADAMKPRNARLLGRQEPEWIDANLHAYQGLVYPGTCAEGAHPMVVREAFSHGVPVLAARGSSAADIVTEHGGGQVYSPSTGELAYALGAVQQDHALYSTAALTTFENVFTKKVWLEGFAAACESAVARFQEQT